MLQMTTVLVRGESLCHVCYCKTKPKVDLYLYLVESILAMCCMLCVFPQLFFL